MKTPLPPLRDVIAAHGLGANKALGQHFLLDLNITTKIARLLEAGDADQIFEIGPGPGGLTRALLDSSANVIAIERDHRCMRVLQEISDHYDGRLRVIEADALKFDETSLLPQTGRCFVASNLPYNISTELLIKWLKAEPCWWSRMVLMFQREVADRILAAPGSKTYGRLSIISQSLSRVSKGFDLPARAFTPPPKVDSTVLVFDPIENHGIDIARLEALTQAAFSQRRKMLRSSLKTVFRTKLEQVLLECDILPTARAEDITVDKWIALSRVAPS